MVKLNKIGQNSSILINDFPTTRTTTRTTKQMVARSDNAGKKRNFWVTLYSVKLTQQFVEKEEGDERAHKRSKESQTSPVFTVPLDP
jgi:hypothetical protein